MPQFSSPPRAAVTEAMSLIEQRTGLAASTRLRLDLDRMLQQIAGGDVPALLGVLRQADIHAPEWQMLISTLTIGETYFMRDSRHFDLLKDEILPQITLEKRRQRNFRLRIWCAGCSTGEEPYSLAITLHEFLPDLPRWSIELVGTDINHHSIKTAKKGVYRDWSFRHTGDYFRRRYFDRLDDNWQIKSHIQKIVTFEQGAIPGRAPIEDCDIIFCRNMMLYLSDRATRATEDMFFRLLKPGGWFFLGHAEAVRHRRDRWSRHIFPGTPIYQKTDLNADPAATPVSYKLSSRDAFLTKFSGRRIREVTPVNDEIETEPITVPDMQTSADYIDAVAALHDEKFAQAKQIMQAVVADKPDDAKSHTVLAALLAGHHDFDTALQHLDTALKIEPLLADAHYVQALIYGEQGNPEHQEKALRAALYCDRTHILATWMLSDLSRQSDNLREAARLSKRARTLLVTVSPDAYLSDVSEMRASRLLALLDMIMS
ncbi:MAG: CheR family methyltransferase [Aggregatilineales bacterium]